MTETSNIIQQASPDDFVRMLVELANATAEQLSDWQSVLKLVADAEIAFAIWQDAAWPHGVGYAILKGEHMFEFAVASQQGLQRRMTAVRARDADEAEAMRLAINHA